MPGFSSTNRTKSIFNNIIPSIITPRYVRYSTSSDDYRSFPLYLRGKFIDLHNMACLSTLNTIAHILLYSVTHDGKIIHYAIKICFNNL